jgi:hypothetical protein
MKTRFVLSDFCTLAARPAPAPQRLHPAERQLHAAYITTSNPPPPPVVTQVVPAPVEPAAARTRRRNRRHSNSSAVDHFECAADR